MPGNQIGTRHLNYEIPPELEDDYDKCLDRQRSAAAAVREGDMVTATDLLKTNLEWCKRNLSADPIHPMTLWHLGELGICLLTMGLFNEAIIYVGEAYDIREAINPEGEETLKILGHYAHALVGDGHLYLAAGQYETLWVNYKKVLGQDSQTALEAGRQAARCWSRAAADRTTGDGARPEYREKAREIYEEVLATWEAKGPAGTINAAEARADLATHYATLGDYPTAEPMFRQCLATLAGLELGPSQECQRQNVEELCWVWLATMKGQLEKEQRRKDEEARRVESAKESRRVQKQQEEIKKREDIRAQEEAETRKKRRELKRQDLEKLKAEEQDKQRDQAGAKQQGTPNTKRKPGAEAGQAENVVRKVSGTGEPHIIQEGFVSGQGIQPFDTAVGESVEVFALSSKGSKSPRLPRPDPKQPAAVSHARLDKVFDPFPSIWSGIHPPLPDCEAVCSGGRLSQKEPKATKGSASTQPPIREENDRTGRASSTPTKTPIITVSETPVTAPSTTAQPVFPRENRGQMCQDKTLLSSDPERQRPLNQEPPKARSLSASTTSLSIQEPAVRSSSTRRARPESKESGDQRHRKSRSIPRIRAEMRDLEMEWLRGEHVSGEKLGTNLKEPTPKSVFPRPRVQLTQRVESQEDSSVAGVPGEKPESKPPAALGSICDATQQLVGDACVDVWFADIKRINEEIFNPYRRQACKRVKIGILDTGIDMKNVAFKGDEIRQRIKKRIDFLDPSGKGTARDKCGHGTHCTALINRIAPAADIYVGRVALDFDTGLDENVVAKAITVALGPKGPGDASQNWDVDILSLSLGFQHFSEAIEAALQSSVRKGKIVLAAASNNGTLRAMAYPAWDSNVIPINSANGRGRPSDFNPPAVPGKTLTILGENVPSAWITSAPTTTATNSANPSDGDALQSTAPTAPADVTATRRMSGTSVATPIAAGVVALLLELAMIEVPDDRATQATLRHVLPHLKRQAGLSELLMRKAVGTGDFRNIVPMDLLSPNLTVGENAAVIKGVLARKFRF